MFASLVKFISVNDLIKKIIKAEYTLEDEPWPQISKEAKDLVSQLLNKDPESRPTPKQAL